MKAEIWILLAGLLPAVLAAQGMEDETPVEAAPEPETVQVDMDSQLRRSLSALAEVRERIAGEKIPLTGQLSALENTLIAARKEYNDVKRQLDRRQLDMNNLRAEIKTRDQEKAYLANLLGEYIRNLESRLHIVELARYASVIEAAKLAPENTDLSPDRIFDEQVKPVDASVARLDELIGGTRFAGRAAGEDGLVKQGQFVLFGPIAYFASADGALAGMAEQRIGSLEPSVTPYANPTFTRMTESFVKSGQGTVPVDASLGNARKVEETRETVREHIEKGGFMMYPIIGVALATLLYCLQKLIKLAVVRMRTPSAARTRRFLDTVREGRKEAAVEQARKLGSPLGRMLRAGAELIGERKDLVEEAMFEVMLETRYHMRGLVPFVAVSAAAAPLMGLLGTVLGIINTFKMLTVFGSGDVKQLSGGISEALITTEAGLILAIPALTFHAILAWLIKGYTDNMEQAAVTFLKNMPGPDVLRTDLKPATGE